MIRKFHVGGPLGLIALGIALCASTAAADVTFNDTGFNDANWQLMLIRGHVPAGGQFVSDPSAGSVSVSQEARGGVLGAYRGVNIFVNDAVGPIQNFVYSFHRPLGAVYNPSISGPIGCITYSEFSRTVSSSEPGGCHCQIGSLALLQTGTVFVTTPGFPTPTAPSGWSPRQQILQKESDFCAMPGYLNGTCVHPDFSATGAPIEFGFIRENSNASAGSAGFTTVGGIDNWQVNVLNTCTACSDSADNDGNGCGDYPQDLGCSSRSDDTESGAGCNLTTQCSDAIDNDGDGCVDFPSDGGCTSSADGSEVGGFCDFVPTVPALSTWGLMALAAVLLGTGVYLLRRAA